MMKRKRNREDLTKSNEKHSSPYISQSKMQKNSNFYCKAERVYNLHRSNGQSQWIDLERLRLLGLQHLIPETDNKKNEELKIFQTRIKNKSMSVDKSEKQYLIERGPKFTKKWVLESTLIEIGGVECIEEFEKKRKRSLDNDQSKRLDVSNKKKSPITTKKQSLQPQKKKVYKKDFLEKKYTEEYKINHDSNSDESSPKWGQLLPKQESSGMTSSFHFNEKLPNFGDEHRQSRRSLHSPVYRGFQSSRSLSSLLSNNNFLNQYREKQKKQNGEPMRGQQSPQAKDNERILPLEQSPKQTKMPYPILRRNPRTIFAQDQLFTHDKMPPHEILVNGPKPVIVRGIYHRVTDSMGYVACFDGQFYHVPQEQMRKHFPQQLLQFLSRRYHKLVKSMED